MLSVVYTGTFLEEDFLLTLLVLNFPLPFSHYQRYQHQTLHSTLLYQHCQSYSENSRKIKSQSTQGLIKEKPNKNKKMIL
jgi:hypothetical protein